MSHENFITFNCNYVYIKYFKHHFNFCVSKSFYYSTDDALLRKAFTDILNCCDIHFTYILKIFYITKNFEMQKNEDIEVHKGPSNLLKDNMNLIAAFKIKKFISS